MSFLIIIAIAVIAGIAWEVIEDRVKRDKSFDAEVAGVSLTYDPLTNTARLHERPNPEQLVAIAEWTKQQPRRPTGWRILEKL